MRKISLCVLCVLWLSVAGAADKNCLPSGEAVENFLIRQVGGGFAELTTDSQQKKPLQLLMEEIVLADGRQKAGGKWIDEIPDTPPPPLPDIEPRLTSLTLYTDAIGANAHVDAFLKRHFYTGHYLTEHDIRPKIIRTLSPDICAWAQKIYSLHELIRKDYKSQTEYLTAVAEVLLYVDFVFAHGDAEAKAHAIYLLIGVQECLTLGGAEPDLAENVAREFLWPMLRDAPISFRENKNFKRRIWDALHFALIKNQKERIRLEKWGVKHAGMDHVGICAYLSLLANAYVDAKDYTGALICHMAGSDPNQTNQDRLHLIHRLFEQQAGAEKGSAYYKRFLDCLASSGTPTQSLQRELSALQKPGTKAPPAPQKKK